jgi:DUF1365 family protein
MHRRIVPRAHYFRYRAFWVLIDLDELPALCQSLRLFSHNRPNVFSIRDTDHGDRTAIPLRTQVERQLRAAGIEPDRGRICLLCMPRTFGYSFNPLSIYFCHGRDGSLAALIYEVHNTLGERHSYVIPVERESGAVHQECDKRFYVSPFMDMAPGYRFRVTAPGERISVGIRVQSSRGAVLNAVLAGERQALTDGALLRLGLTMPAITMKVIIAIHWEALRLWLKGLRYRSKLPAHPAAGPISPASPKSVD